MSENIESFWGALLLHKELLSVPESDKEEQMMEVLRALQQIDPRLYYHIGHRDDGPDLLLSAEGLFELSDTIREIIATAPALPGWRVQPILESDALFGKRNSTLFPDDENGDILYSIAVRAGDLISRKGVDFCHVFPKQSHADGFANQIDPAELSAIERYDGRDGFSWQVIITRQIIPSHANISSTEASLAELAADYSGEPDGWGFMSSE